MNPAEKVYLGDGIYIQRDERDAVILTAVFREDPGNRIVMKPQAVINLLIYLKVRPLSSLTELLINRDQEIRNAKNPI
jgi:hypothetical protein